VTPQRILRFLVVEDNEMTRAALRTIINSEAGYSVVGEAANGESGIEMARRLKPDIVCLDIVMPHRDGVQVLQQLRAELPNTAIIMISGNREAKTVRTAVELGASGFVVKPFNAGKVLDTLDHIAARLRTQRQA